MSQAKQACTRGCLKRNERFVEDVSNETKDLFEDVSSETSMFSMMYPAKRARCRGCLKRIKHAFEDVSSDASIH
eukprot:4393698-Pyramimonas_sp.AAC.1